MLGEHIFILIKTIDKNGSSKTVSDFKRYEECVSVFKLYGTWDYLIELKGKKNNVIKVSKDIILSSEVISYQILTVME
jgi:hypothetical protein